MLHVLTKILSDPLLYGLKPLDQATIVKTMNIFMKEQMKDIKLRSKRSTILKNFDKRIDVADKEYEENNDGLSIDSYLFLRAYFKWEATIDRNIHKLRLTGDERKYATDKKDAKDILLQNCDILVEWLFVKWKKRKAIFENQSAKLKDLRDKEVKPEAKTKLR